MGQREWVRLLEQLEQDNGSCSYFAVIMSKARPWIKKYIWLASGPAPEGPKEIPADSDHLFIAVRNPSARRCLVDFECEAKHGRLKFDKAGSSGFRYSERILAVPAKDRTSIPVVRNTSIQIMQIDEPSEIILIKAITSEDASGEWRPILTEEGEFVLSFS